MKIFVTVKPSARERAVEKVDETHYDVRVPEPPANGLANKGVVKALADYFHLPPSRIMLLKGFRSRQKVVEILR